MKVQVHSSLEPPLEYHHDQMPLTNQLTHLGSFRLVVQSKTGKEMPGSSIVHFLEKFLAINFALSDAEETPQGH